MRTCLVAITTLAVLLLGSHSLAADTWRVGVAKAPITPHKPMWMAGYASRKGPAEGKQTELYAKAIVLEDAQKKRAVLITLDLIGVDRDLALPLRQQVADKLKLSLAQVMICSSHTHSGPVVAKNLRPLHYLLLDEAQRKLVDAYARSLEETVLQVVDVARMRLAPAELSRASGVCTVAVNRRNNKEPEVPQLREQNKLLGPSDHDVPVLAVHSTSGQLQAIVFGYACHATVLDGRQWSGDYPAYAQMALEKRHPTAVALFWAGCGGDQNPLPRRHVPLAEKYGTLLADSVDSALAAERTTVAPQLVATYEEIPLALAKLPTREELQAQTNDTNVYVASRAKHLLAEIDAGQPLSPTYPYPIATWKLGQEVDWIFLGGEVVVDYALRLKSERNAQNTWVAAYANDVMAYIPSRRVLVEGGYEGAGAMVFYGLPTVWSEQVEESIVDAVPKP